MSTPKSLSLLDHFDKLEDPRMNRRKRHKLLDIIFIAVCAVIAGSNDYVSMEKYGRAKLHWLKKYLELPNGIPSHDTFSRVIGLLKPEKFIECFLSWVEALDQCLNGKLVAIDGKTARATLDRAKDMSPLHVVSAWVSANNLLLGQVAVSDKSNEITAIPQLLQMLELEGAIVSIDAMGCQKAIVEQIREQKAHYVVTVKANQEHLEKDIVEYFAKADDDKLGRLRPSVFETDEKTHGRKDNRHYEAFSVPATLRNLEQWKDLKSICRVTRTYLEKGVNKSEVRFFISSLPADAKRLAQAIRGHWGVENGLHWMLDMYFGEDRHRGRSGHAPENFALLRRWVLCMLRQDKTLNCGIEKKRQQAGWNNEIMETLLASF